MFVRSIYLFKLLLSLLFIAHHFHLLMVCFTVTVTVCGEEVFVVKVKVVV